MAVARWVIAELIYGNIVNLIVSDYLLESRKKGKCKSKLPA